mmetsp:Transcript_114069/g.261768  ORF Transcript_114069/g.261768 Transcript_114069/m.261768 type:complete len:392 (+) Transcript_114069:27-1202(+)
MGCATSCGSVDYGINDQGERFYDKYDLGPKLGRGAFGIVREVMLSDDHKQVFAAKILTRVTEKVDKRAQVQRQVADLRKAIGENDGDADAQEMRRRSLKVLRKELEDLTTRTEDDVVRKEVELLQKCSHPRICCLHDVFESPLRFVLVLTRCYDRFERCKAWGGWEDERVPAAFFLDLCEALAFIHEKDVIHRDVKPENMMLDAEGQAVLCDFGLACQLSPDQPVSVDIAGTQAYMPPECFECGQSKASDMWAAGCTLYWMLFDMVPDMACANAASASDARGSGKFGRTKSSDRIRSGVRSLRQKMSFSRQSKVKSDYAPDWDASQAMVSQCFDPVTLRKVRPYQDPRSEEVVQLCKQLLTLEAERRPTAQACCKHSWVVGPVAPDAADQK